MCRPDRRTPPPLAVELGTDRAIPCCEPSLDYLAGRHDVSHPTLAPDPEATAVATIHTVFDRLER